MDLRIAFTLIHMMYKDLSNPSPRFFHIFSLSSKRLGIIYLHDAHFSGWQSFTLTGGIERTPRCFVSAVFWGHRQTELNLFFYVNDNQSTRENSFLLIALCLG